MPESDFSHRRYFTQEFVHFFFTSAVHSPSGGGTQRDGAQGVTEKSANPGVPFDTGPDVVISGPAAAKPKAVQAHTTAAQCCVGWGRQ